MNATSLHAPLATHMPVPAPQRLASNPQAPGRYRERGFGIGYGASSGYAPDKRYTSDWGQARFRCR